MLNVATICINVLIYGALGWAIVGAFGNWSQARLAGLFLATGFALGSFGGHAATETEHLLRLRAVGSILGLAILSLMSFFRRATVVRPSNTDVCLAPVVASKRNEH
jgi:hypothetical protein